MNRVEYYEIDLTKSESTSLLALVDVIKEFNPQVIINNDNCYMQQLAPIFNCNFIAVGHLLNYTIGSLLKINKEYVDNYIAISTDMKLDMVNRLDIEPGKISVVYNGLFNSNYIKPVARSRPNIIKVLIGAEYSYRKGADKIIELIKRNVDNVEYHWTVGHLPKRILNKINKYNVNIYKRLDKNEFIELSNSCHVVLIPSREEGCPMLLLEAISIGLVPIVSDGIGAMKEIIKHGKNGYVCSLSNWASEVDKIFRSSQFLSNYEQLSINAISLFEDSFSKGEFSEALLNTKMMSDKNVKNNISIYQWHRKGKVPGKFIQSIINRVSYRFGYIRKVGELEFSNKDKL